MTTTHPNLFPYVVPASWVAHTGTDGLVYWPVASDVFVILVCDAHGTVRNVLPDELTALGMDEAAAFQVAAENLGKAWEAGAIALGSATLLDGTQVGCARGSWMAPAAALVLGNFHAALAAEFGTTELVAVAVNQECLFAFPPDAATLASTSLRTEIDNAYKSHRKPVSRQWLRLDGTWPQQYDGEQLF